MGKTLAAYIVSFIITTLVGFAILTLAGLGTIRTSIICAFSLAIVGTFLPPLFVRLLGASKNK